MEDGERFIQYCITTLFFKYGGGGGGGTVGYSSMVEHAHGTVGHQIDPLNRTY